MKWLEFALIRILILELFQSFFYVSIYTALFATTIYIPWDSLKFYISDQLAETFPHIEKTCVWILRIAVDNTAM